MESLRESMQNELEGCRSWFRHSQRLSIDSDHGSKKIELFMGIMLRDMYHLVRIADIVDNQMVECKDVVFAIYTNPERLFPWKWHTCSISQFINSVLTPYPLFAESGWPCLKKLRDTSYIKAILLTDKALRALLIVNCISNVCHIGHWWLYYFSF